MKIGPGVSELWGVENRPLPLTRPMAYTRACATVQAVIRVVHDTMKRYSLTGRSVSVSITITVTMAYYDAMQT